MKSPYTLAHGMKCMMSLALFAALALGTARSSAEETVLSAAVSGEVYAPGNQSNHLKNTGNNLCRFAVANGVPCSSSYNSYVTSGGRYTIFEEKDNSRFAASLSLLNGGPRRGRVSVNALAPAPGGVTLTLKSTVFRVLPEMSRKFPMGEDWAFSFGAGAGWALSNETVYCTESGSLLGSCAGTGGTTNFGWATWEATPSILFKGFELGVRYMGFARRRQTPWNTWGGTAGYRF